MRLRAATVTGFLLVAGVVAVGAVALGPRVRRGVDCAWPRGGRYGCGDPAGADLPTLLTALAVIVAGTVVIWWALLARIIEPETHAVVAWTTLQLVSTGAVVTVGVAAVRQLIDDAPNSPRVVGGLVLVMVAALLPMLIGRRRPLPYAVVCSVLAAGALLWAASLVIPAGPLVGFAGLAAMSAVSALHASADETAGPSPAA